MSTVTITIAYVVVGLVIFLWANWPRSATGRDRPAIPPSFSCASGFAWHDFYVGITLEAFTAAWPEKTFDFLGIDTQLDACVIAVVTVDNWIGPAEFRTEFLTSAGETVVKTWSPAAQRRIGTATGLFVLPDSMIGARTEICTTP